LRYKSEYDLVPDVLRSQNLTSKQVQEGEFMAAKKDENVEKESRQLSEVEMSEFTIQNMIYTIGSESGWNICILQRW
jgi:hypothetical protein